MGDFLDYFKKKKNLTSLLLLGILILGLPIGIQLLKQQQILKSRAESSGPIRFIQSDTEFQQTPGNDSTWATTDANISFNLYSPFGFSGVVAGTPTPTPSPTPVSGGGGATPVLTSTPTPTPTPVVPLSDKSPSNLKTGWNLISFPRSLAGSNSPSVLNGVANKIYYFDSSLGWKYALLQGGAWSGTLSSLESGKGYFVNATVDLTFNFDVKNKDTMPSINLAPDLWHMVGYFTSEGLAPMDVLPYLTKIGMNVAGDNWTVYRDDNAYAMKRNGVFQSTFSQFEVGRGYWICSSQSCGTTPKPE